MLKGMKSIVDRVRESMEVLGAYTVRYGIMIMIAVIGIIGTGASSEVARQAISLAIVTEAVAIMLSWSALYAYTRTDFLGAQKTDVIARVFLAVHILVGLVILGAFVVFAEHA